MPQPNFDYVAMGYYLHTGPSLGATPPVYPARSNVAGLPGEAARKRLRDRGTQNTIHLAQLALSARFGTTVTLEKDDPVKSC